MRILSILLITTIVLSPINAAKKTAKLAKGSYHQLCLDLNDNITKPGKSLTRSEKNAIQTYLNAKTVSRLKRADLIHFENAINKHRFIELKKSFKSKSLSKKMISKTRPNNLKKWPRKSSVGKWYQLKKSSKGGGSKKVNNSSKGNEDQDNGQIN